MECIRSVSYSIFFKGEPKGNIKPTRGIRQGDRLSSYLFLLCLKGLNGLIPKVVTNGCIPGFSLCKNGSKVSHLFFVNDSLLFCRTSMSDIRTIQEILNQSELASGQQINRQKTNLFFRKFVSTASKDAIKEFLGVLEIIENEKYLGLLAVVGKKKRASLNCIKERLWNKIQG